MTHDELVAEVKRLQNKAECNKKSAWDKCQVIGTLLAGVLVPLALALVGYKFSSIITDQQIQSSKAIAADNLRLGQLQLTASLMKSLSSSDAHERKQAINFVFIVLPEEMARKLTDALSQSDSDPGVRASATNALEARLSELTKAAVSSDPEKSQVAASHLTNVWRNDPEFSKNILAAADQRKGDPQAQATTVDILNTLDPRQLRPHSNEVAELIRRVPENNPQFQQNVRMLNQKLQKRD